MSLPKISHPLFDVIIPSSKKKVKMRPFLVKEEKILLIAQTSDNPNDIVEAIKQVINNCFVDDVSIDDLTTFDLEYIFVKLRARSVTHLIELKYTDPDDGSKYDVIVDLDAVEIKEDPRHANKIELTDTSGIVLRYPKTDMINSIKKAETEVDLFFNVIKYCIDKVYDEDSIYALSDFTEEEQNDFLNELDVNTFTKIQTFLETMPRLYYEAAYMTKDGAEKKLILNSLTDFFTLG